MFSKPIAAYQQIDLESNVRGADPHYLIVLLFDGAESALNQAQIKLSENDIAGKSSLLKQATAIILEGLAASLNLNEGGELAQNLNALYQYMGARLVHANIHNDAAAIREVQKLLGELSSAWKEMGKNLKQSTGA